jgi:hypothetical protein
LQDAPGVATKMKDEITYKPQNDATFGQQSGSHGDFTYSISGNVISITDLNLGNRSVTNDAESRVQVRSCKYLNNVNRAGSPANKATGQADARVQTIRDGGHDDSRY